MIDHTGVSVTDGKRSRAWYEKALLPLGYAVIQVVPPEHTGGKLVLGMGVPSKADFWLHECEEKPQRVHVAFRAESRAVVDAFHAAALEAGGTDNGAPGLRPHYHKDYYGAFVLDPDGHNIEACCHAPE